MFGFFKKKPEEKYESILERAEDAVSDSDECEPAPQPTTIVGQFDDYTPDNYDVLESGGVLTPDSEDYVQLSDEELFFEAAGGLNTTVNVKLKSVHGFDTDAYLAGLEQLPYEFRHYLDTRRAFAKALKNCGDDIGEYASYEGGKSSVWSTSFDFDDAEVTLEFELSRADDNAPFVFTAKITAE